MNRFDRIISILIQLQSRKVVRASDMASRFDVSLRTIYRDIRTLEEAGVPIIGEAGNGYSLVDGYRLPPVMFSREEAMSFVAGEKLMEGFGDANLRKHYSSAMYKLKSVLRGSEQDMVSTLETTIDIKNNHEPFNNQIPDALEIILQAIADKLCIHLNYQAFETDSPTQRMIEPIGLFYENNYWYAMAYCQLRHDYRQFRIDRIHDIMRTDAHFDREHVSMAQLRTRSIEGMEKISATILVDKKVARYIQGGRRYFGFQSERDLGEWIEMDFLVYDCDEDFPRWLISFGDNCRIVKPESLQNRMVELVENLQVHFLTPTKSQSDFR